MITVTKARCCPKDRVRGRVLLKIGRDKIHLSKDEAVNLGVALLKKTNVIKIMK